MKRVLGVYRSILQTLSWKNYEAFADSKMKNTFNYFSTMLFNAFVIMLILLLPAMIMLPSTIEGYINNGFDTLRLDYQIRTIKPVMIPAENPKLMINYANITPTESATVIINNDVLYTGLFFQKYTKNFGIYRDVKQQANAVSNILSFMFLLMLPTLLLIFFFYNFIWFLAIALIAAVIAMIVATVIRYKVTFKKMFNTAMYGITLTVFLDLIFFAIGFSFYYIQYLPLVIYMFAGLLQSGEKIDRKMRHKFIEVKG